MRVGRTKLLQHYFYAKLRANSILYALEMTNFDYGESSLTTYQTRAHFETVLLSEQYASRQTSTDNTHTQFLTL